jgi:predicted O-methyltransferase YrrM
MARLAEHLGAEFVVGVDRAQFEMTNAQVIPVESRGYQEDVQDELIPQCAGEYILRLDDDETVSPVLERWLADGVYRMDTNWNFARAWLYQSPYQYIRSAPHWPDCQTRLSVACMAGGRRGLHQMSPFGMGRAGPGALLHHKLLVRSQIDREVLLNHYDARQHGAGMCFRHFYIPEDYAVDVAVWEDNLTGEEIIRRAGKLDMPMQQHDDEILQFVNWYLQRFGRPTRVLEIGTGHGGTAALWAEMVQGPDAQVISVDIPLGVHGGLNPHDVQLRNERLKAEYPAFHAITADSQRAETRALVQHVMGGMFDLALIDGDHRYESVKRDFELYAPLVKKGRPILLHDIADTPLYRSLQVNVIQFWTELVGEKVEWNFHPDCEWGGLGAVIL